MNFWKTGYKKIGRAEKLEKYFGRALYFMALLLVCVAVYTASTVDVWGIACGMVLVLMAGLYIMLGIMFVNWNNKFFVRRFGK